MDRLVLAGLSNGGLGVTRAVSAYPDAWRGVVLLSAVIEPAAVPELAGGLRNRHIPMLVIHGRKDRRIPVAVVERAVRDLTHARVNVTSNFIPEADHFMFFSHRQACVETMDAWLRQVLTED